MLCILNVGTVPTLCILNVGTVPTLCILNVGTVPTFSHSLYNKAISYYVGVFGTGGGCTSFG